MIIHLLRDPWAAIAAHVIDAASLHEWRQEVAAVRPQRFAAAVIIDQLDTEKPFPVQWFQGAGVSREVFSSDGFLVVRTGLAGTKLAELQWQAISSFPAQLAAAMAFSADVRSMTRQAIFPPLQMINPKGTRHDE